MPSLPGLASSTPSHFPQAAQCWEDLGELDQHSVCLGLSGSCWVWVLWQGQGFPLARSRASAEGHRPQAL